MDKPQNIDTVPLIAHHAGDHPQWHPRHHLRPRRPGPHHGGGVDNTPTESWDQLWTALNADPRTTRQLFFITNFTWRQSNRSPDEIFR
ncbi:hypothetical protein HC928_09630 [bacterium]|nr:hypothetical protein [bacterium]